jgi:hypothetical protein
MSIKLLLASHPLLCDFLLVNLNMLLAFGHLNLLFLYLPHHGPVFLLEPDQLLPDPRAVSLHNTQLLIHLFQFLLLPLHLEFKLNVLERLHGRACLAMGLIFYRGEEVWVRGPGIVKYF